MWAKDFSVELRLRYAHSLGHPDMEFNLYDVGLMFYNASHRRTPCFQLGYRNVDARTRALPICMPSTSRSCFDERRTIASHGHLMASLAAWP